MDHFLICENPSCRFVVDVRIQGKRGLILPFILARCPECGGKWSSTCPFSGRALAVEWVAGLPCCSCCSRKLLGEAKAA
jgi:hypothetical protein